MAVRTFSAQKAGLTRAVKKAKANPTEAGYQELVRECQRTKEEWDSREGQFGPGWPDDWARWQRALDDNLPGNRWFGPRLEAL